MVIFVSFPTLFYDASKAIGWKIISFSANDGFTVYKSVPYGPLDEVLPYLSRRVTENRAVLDGARKERDLLASELSRRIFKRNWKSVNLIVRRKYSSLQ